MIRLALASARASRARLTLTWAAVVIAVAFVTASLVLTETSDRLLDEQFRTAATGVDLTVRDAAAFDSAMGVEVTRDPLPAGLVERVAAVPGVADASPTVTGPALLEVDGVPASGATVLRSWAPAPFTALELRSGRAPAGAGEVVLDAATATAQGVRLGDVVDVVATGTATLEVVGTVGVGDADGLPGTTSVLVDLATAQRLLDLGDGVTQVDVVTSAPAAEVRTALAADLGADYAVTTGADTAAASAAAAKDSLAFLRVVLLALAGAGLLVGAFLIANTFAIVVAQRRRELAVLRAAGASGRQVGAAVLLEALLVGVTGAAAGTALGVAGAAGLRGVAAGLGLALPDGALVVSPVSLAVGLVLGTVVTVLASLGPVRRAARVAPVEAMREAATGDERRGRLRTATGAGLGVLAVAALAVASATGQLLALGAGAALLLVALVVAGPAVAPPLVRLLGRRLPGIAGRLATESAARAPRRTAATVMGLALSLAVITFMSVLAGSVKESIGAGYREVVTADYVVESAGNEMLGGLSPEVARRVAALPEVEVASVLRYGHWKDSGVVSALTAVDPATLGDVTDVDLVAGDLADLAGGGVAVAEGVATERGLTVGDELVMTFARTGDVRLPVVAVVDPSDARALSTDFLISAATYEAQFSERVDAGVLVRTADGVSADAARGAIERAVADYPAAEVRDQAAAVAGRAAMVDQVLALVTVLVAFASLIALLGIANTLALSVVERTREIGLLRAVGMSRGQVRAMVRTEAVLLAVVGAVVGLGAGVGVAAGGVGTLGTAVALSVPVLPLLAAGAVATVAGVVAGALPARRAARLDVLAAIAGA